MAIPVIAHLGPAGTYAEMAAMAFGQQWVSAPASGAAVQYQPFPTIAQALEAVAQARATWAVVPVENSVEGSVPMTLDTLWKYPQLHIEQALVLPIAHAFLSHATHLNQVGVVYSHPQALAQCQDWLDRALPQAQRVPLNSTAQAVQQLEGDPCKAAIASLRAASLYGVPVLDYPINDSDGNCTRFLAVSQTPSPGGPATSIGFSVHGNTPGVLMRALEIFAKAGINMSRIESRPTKRSMGDYRFFIDLEGDATQEPVRRALHQLEAAAETFRLLGSYAIQTLSADKLSQVINQASQTSQSGY